MNSRIARIVVTAFVLASADPRESHAALSFTVAEGGWPSAAHRDAAVSAMQSAVGRYNAYGDFGNYNIYVYYNAGIPTAQASYLGSIGFGGTYPNERVTMHEMAHYLGSGTYGAPWDGLRGETLVDQFDGHEANLNGDSIHFWPYGLNYDSEGSEINKQRHVALVYAQRADMGIGSTANPWSATSVSLTASDALGASGFHYANTWSDGRFAHPGAAYSTGNFMLRTPASGNSFTFVGDSLTVNNTNGINGGLLYKGTGSTGTTTFKNLVIDGGYVRHANGSSDVFRLAGNATLSQSAVFDAAQGPIHVTASLGGTGSLVKTGGFVMTLQGAAAYAGDTTINGGILRLAPVTPVASYTFDSVSGSTVVNAGSGGAAMNGTLAGGATIVAGGRDGNAVSLSGGASVNINNPILDLRRDGNWTVSTWVKTATPGSTILTKGNGTSWSSGNTIFYLGDGTAGGSGGVPSAVRWGGGFFQGAAGSEAVTTNDWRQVTYVNSGGYYAIYVDGELQPLSSGNSSFANFDVGTVVRLGATTNTFAGDGTVHFNGLMDGVQFYDQALSGAQIAALYEGTNVHGTLPTTTNVTIAGGATLDVNGTVQAIGSLAGAVNSAVTLGAGRLIVDSAANTQFSGAVSGTGGSLVKRGAGTLTLTGPNAYTGGTQIDGGAVRVNGSVVGPLVVNAGGMLQGTGVVAGTATIADGGAVAPGSGPGVLTLGGLDLQAGSHTFVELGGLVRGSQYDAIVVNGLANFGGSLTVSLINGLTPAAGDSFDLFDWNSTSGAFDALILPSLPTGLAWDAANLLSTGVLAVAAATFPPGDFDLDGMVTASDLSMWQTHYGVDDGADADGDGVSDGRDFLVWQRNFGASSVATATTQVPEPSSAAATLMLALAAWTRRRAAN
ncbi:MAG: autotransporter-associated beta strand repeat-containing protein [Pirellulales bacterium]|nr:autotransporter-associated beta strand repeat-containing protein [Pirellulales bacterium]